MLATTIEPSVVRLATEEDEDQLLALCRMDHEENGIRDGLGQLDPFSADKVRAIIQRAVTPSRNEPNAGHSVCGVIGPRGGLQASVYLDRSDYGYSDRAIFRQRWAIVAHDYRKSQHYSLLTEFAKVMADCLERTLIAEPTSAHRVEAQERFYTRKFGVERRGSIFIYNHAVGA